MSLTTVSSQENASGPVRARRASPRSETSDPSEGPPFLTRLGCHRHVGGPHVEDVEAERARTGQHVGGAQDVGRRGDAHHRERLEVGAALGRIGRKEADSPRRDPGDRLARALRIEKHPEGQGHRGAGAGAGDLRQAASQLAQTEDTLRRERLRGRSATKQGGQLGPGHTFSYRGSE